MGRPKALVEFDGEPMAARVARTLAGVVERLVLVGDGPVPPLDIPHERIADVPGILGPLAGMLAAMRRCTRARWIFAACDQPLVRREALDWLLAQAGPGAPAVLPLLSNGRLQPLLALYEPAALPELERLALRRSAGPEALRRVRGVRTPTPPRHLEPCWHNVNTPEDLARLEPRRP